MKLKELPAVASSFYTGCKKCDLERYHKVLSHSSKIAAKIECEVCGSKKTFKLTTSKTTKKKSSTTRKSAKAAEQTLAQHTEIYQKLTDKIGLDQSQLYGMEKMFDVNTAIEHPKFGMGFVMEKSPKSISVMFADSFKNLVHNR